MKFIEEDEILLQRLFFDDMPLELLTPLLQRLAATDDLESAKVRVAAGGRDLVRES